MKTLSRHLFAAHRALLLTFDGVFEANVAKDVTAIGQDHGPAIALDF